MSDPFRLDGRRAVVTGSASGIGQAIAVALARQGADVAGLDVDGAGLASTQGAVELAGRRFLGQVGSIGERADVEGIASAVVEAWGGLDIWINCAARMLVRPFDQMTEADWSGLLQVNLTGTFLGCKAAADRMTEGGRIVNISSAVDALAISGITILGAITPIGGLCFLAGWAWLMIAPPR